MCGCVCVLVTVCVWGGGGVLVSVCVCVWVDGMLRPRSADGTECTAPAEVTSNKGQ